MEYQLAIASLRELNVFSCLSSDERDICAPLSCPITLVPETGSIEVFMSSYTNFTMVQFFEWNPYIDTVVLGKDDTVCVG